MEVLVTGGAGYIGSHVCICLLKSGYEVVIVDNLSNSRISTIESIEKITNRKVNFYKIDVTNSHELEKVFKNYNLMGVIHLAGLKSVAESFHKPLEYYYNNVVSTTVLVSLCIKYKVNRFVFSSSATVYGDNNSPFVETMQLKPTTNPYGETKVMSERILKDVVSADPNIAVALLRYFNPVGAHESGLIGDSPKGVPNNLMPYITQVAKGKLDKLIIYGNDYPTIDGTGVRDYIHVMDLAEGHVVALEKLKKGANVYNLGTGKGTSVMQLLKAFESVNGVKIPYEINGRRSGDIAESYADVSKAKAELNWCAKRDVFDMCRDAWRFELNNSK